MKFYKWIFISIFSRYISLITISLHWDFTQTTFFTTRTGDYTHFHNLNILTWPIWNLLIMLTWNITSLGLHAYFSLTLSENFIRIWQWYVVLILKTIFTNRIVCALIPNNFGSKVINLFTGLDFLRLVFCPLSICFFSTFW